MGAHEGDSGEAGDLGGALLSCSGSLKAEAEAEAGDAMQGFVSLHLTSILQPFAASVHELQGQVRQLCEDSEALRGEVGRQGSTLAGHDQRLEGLRAGAEQVDDGLERTQAELKEVKRDRNRLDGDHVMTKAAVKGTKEALGAVTSSVEALQASLRECGDRLSKVEAGIPDSEKKVMEQLEFRLNKQGRVCKDLSDRQTELHKACEQAKLFGEAASAAVNKLTEVHESRSAEGIENMSDLRGWATTLDQKVQDMELGLQKATHSQTATDRDVQHLKTWTGELVDIKALHEQVVGTSHTLKEQELRLEALETDLFQLNSRAGAEREQQSADVCAIEVRINKSIQEVMRWRDEQRAHTDLICSAGQRLADLEHGQQQLAERSSASSEDLQSLVAWRCDAARSLADQGAALAAAQARLRQAQDGVAEAGAGLAGLRAEFGSSREALARLGARLDVCYKCFSGLGKGLQDTHRQIVGSEGAAVPLMPPKMGSGGTVLPAIATPRATSQPPARKATPRGR